MIRVHMRLAIILALSTLTGCASNGAIRVLAGRTAATAERYAAATENFAKVQTSAAESDRLRISAYTSAAAPANSDAALLQRSWVLGGDKKKIERYAAISSVSADALLQQLTPAAAGSPAPWPGDKGVDVKDTVKALRQIEKKSTLLSQVMFLGDYGEAVQKELAKLRKAAQDEAAKASDAAGSASQ